MLTTRSGICWLGFSFIAGFLIAIGLYWWDMPTPAGSLILGVMTGYYIARTYVMRATMRNVFVIGCVVVSIAGWLVALPFMR